jgi:hypothetical protein
VVVSNSQAIKVVGQREPEMNELKLFIANTLEAVLEGISEGQNLLARKITISPATRVEGAPYPHEFMFAGPKEITFDVAVTVARKKGKGGGLELKVLGVGANGKLDSGSEEMTASRISFTVPVHRLERSDND